MSFLDWLRNLLNRPHPSPQPPRPVPPRPSPGPNPTPGSTAAQLLAGHNDARRKAGLAPLSPNPVLQQFVQDHAEAQAVSGKMSHDGAGDGSFSSRIASSGYQYKNCGENVAWNQASVADVMEDWMGSPGHRANILGNFSETGLAVAYGKHGSAEFGHADSYWSVVFGLPGIGYGVFVEVHAPAGDLIQETPNGFLVPAKSQRPPGPDAP